MLHCFIAVFVRTPDKNLSGTDYAMNKSLRFSHKILLAASLIVIVAFSLFTLYNDYLQRNAIHENLENYLAEMGESTSTNIRNLFEGRIKLVENLAQNIAQQPEQAETLMGQNALISSFLTVYLARSMVASACAPTRRCPKAMTLAPAPGTRTA